ncbi:MAG: sigma-54-dependent Fis family transcriptional regulator [Muribaculaceae bacterium]|nr:sigma-54-dependent Fis family transcriptional regulator [Muribaculaceae bacterium]
MTGKNGRILIVDDNEDILLSLNLLLKPHVEAIRALKSPERIGEFMNSFEPDVIILDMNFRRNQSSGEEGYHWLNFILKKSPDTVVLLITAYVDTEKVVRGIRAGATDFIPKPWDNAKLVGIVESALKLRSSRRNPVAQNNAASSPVLIGECPQIQLLRRQIEKIGATEANVLITGENGTGKDVAAHLLHHFSPRHSKPFVSIDLGAVPEQLFESELFGYEKGAFTDAKMAKEGRIETANGGTVFLDEIGNLTQAMQQKLLTTIEKRQLARLGSNKTKQVDVRIVTATNADLPQMVADGTFRQDLLYRINTFELHMPPLRERGNDIILLAEYFADKIAERYHIENNTIGESAKSKLLSHDWPGNVRELQHVMERAMILASGRIITSDDIEFPRSVKPKDSSETLNLETLEKKAIMTAIDQANGNLSTAASLLGISRYALYRKIEKYGL